MKALSIRPHFAHAILHLGKSIENRSWTTRYRGPLLIHASKTLTARELALVQDLARRRRRRIPEPGSIRAGGLVGIVDLVDIVAASTDVWFAGPYGWVLRDPCPIRFVPMTGRLRLFEVPDGMIELRREP